MKDMAPIGETPAERYGEMAEMSRMSKKLRHRKSKRGSKRGRRRGARK